MTDIHKIKEEELVLTIDDQLFFDMILLKIRGSCISYASSKRRRRLRWKRNLCPVLNNMKIIFVKAMYID